MTLDSRATRFAGIPFRHLDMDAAAHLLLSEEGLGTAQPWRLVNAYSVTLAARDEAYGSVLRGEGVNLADGTPVAWTLRTLCRREGSTTSPDRVRGPSFFSRVLDQGRTAGVRHFLLGGSPETLAALQDAIAERFPGTSIVGVESPPFRPLTADELADQDRRIRQSGADLVWVGLGTPRQDIEAARLARTVGRPAIAVGAAFDFLAGTKPEAPAWVQRLSLEWLFRFASEPRRLWRRYTVELVRLAILVVRELRAQRRTVPALTGSARVGVPVGEEPGGVPA
jgi:N-acetylglucosaminyldiphosphoundecaprenol N-acetyl-beta-D-mannosaminyltransferase